ncbi:MAG: 4'-phosphopantetheinyl transferase family protein [Methylomicrobium sp.]
MIAHSLNIRLGRLCVHADDSAYYWGLLNGEEQHRAEGINNPQRQAYYIETYGRLRMLLGEATDSPPETLRFSKHPHGKPYLVDFPEIAFNLSHTADRIAVVIGRSCRVGIDIEACKPRTNLAALADKCFGAEEIAYWQALSETEQFRAFYHFWTYKEAFVKAVGRGIGLGLHHCVVDPANPSRMLHVPASCGPAENWSLHTLDVGNEVCGAVAVDGPIAAVNMEAF